MKKFLEEQKDIKKEADGQHPDAEKDKALIMDMLKKHVADGENIEEAYSMAKEAYEAYTEMGHSKEKALERCEGYVEMAKYMAKKEALKKDSEKREDKKESKKESEDKEKKDEDKKEEKNKESANEEIVRLRGELAALKESNAKRDLEDYIDAELQKSGLSRAVTKSFRESIKDVKSKSEFDKLFKVFNEGFKLQAEGGEAHKFTLGTEKNVQNKFAGVVDLSGLNK